MLPIDGFKSVWKYDKVYLFTGNYSWKIYDKSSYKVIS